MSRLEANRSIAVVLPLISGSGGGVPWEEDQGREGTERSCWQKASCRCRAEERSRGGKVRREDSTCRDRRSQSQSMVANTETIVRAKQVTSDTTRSTPGIYNRCYRACPEHENALNPPTRASSLVLHPNAIPHSWWKATGRYLQVVTY